MTELYTVKQVADKFEVHPETIRRLAKSGDLPARKIGNEWRFSEKDLQDFLDHAKVNPSTTVQ
jgi:excisionase family DNA binding protein